SQEWLIETEAGKVMLGRMSFTVPVMWLWVAWLAVASGLLLGQSTPAAAQPANPIQTEQGTAPAALPDETTGETDRSDGVVDDGFSSDTLSGDTLSSDTLSSDNEDDASGLTGELRNLGEAISERFDLLDLPPAPPPNVIRTI